MFQRSGRWSVLDWTDVERHWWNVVAGRQHINIPELEWRANDLCLLWPNDMGRSDAKLKLWANKRIHL
jgi:hypothetical protein